MKSMLKLLCLLPVVSLKILGLLWRGKEYFVVPTWQQGSKSLLPNAGDTKWHEMFNFNLICFCNHKSLSLNTECFLPLVRNVARLWWLFDIRPTGTQTCHGFKMHNLITFELKVQVVVCLSGLVTFNPWKVTRSPPIRKRIWVGRYNNKSCIPSLPKNNSDILLAWKEIRFTKKQI